MKSPKWREELWNTYFEQSTNGPDTLVRLSISELRPVAFGEIELDKKNGHIAAVKIPKPQH